MGETESISRLIHLEKSKSTTGARLDAQHKRSVGVPTCSLALAGTQRSVAAQLIVYNISPSESVSELVQCSLFACEYSTVVAGEPVNGAWGWKAHLRHIGVCRISQAWLTSIPHDSTRHFRYEIVLRSGMWSGFDGTIGSRCIPRAEMCGDEDGSRLTDQHGVIESWKQHYDKHLHGARHACTELKI